MSELQATFPSTSTFEGTVDEDAVAAFALATNDRNPRYLDGQAVPPLFTATLILRCAWEAQRVGVDRDDITGAKNSVHGQHDVHFHGLIRPGMALRWSGATFSVRATK